MDSVWKRRSLVGLLVVGVLVAALLPMSHQIGYDFKAYVVAARDLVAGENPYHRLLVSSPDVYQGGLLRSTGYVYPPLLAELLAIPVRLGASTQVIWLGWMLLNLAAILWLGATLNQALRGSRDLVGTLAFAIAVSIPAIVIYDLSLGQADVLMEALAVGACALRPRHPWMAALAIGVAIAVKPTLGLILPLWIWQGDWRSALRGALVSVGLLVVPFAIAGGQATRDYIAFFTQWSALRGDAAFVNQSLLAVLLRGLSPNALTHPLLNAPWLVTPLRYAVMLGALVIFARAVPFRSPRLRDPRQLMASSLLALPLIVLLSPSAEDIHHTMLIAPMVGLGWLAWERGLRHLAASWVLWGIYALSSIPRMQELIYPGKLFPLPGQHDPHLMTIVI
ncbi:MAG TPA: glycosyltransferase family 87 protein, partial [Ktedonobacterales bacterium]